MRVHFLLASFFFAVIGSAQEPASRPRLARSSGDVEVIRAQLAASAPTAIAWGGYNAALAGRPELVADVRAALGRAARLGDGERWICETALLDALIRLDARMEPGELHGWWARGQRHAALVCAAREGARAVPFLVQAFADDPVGVAGLAVCNLLLAHAPRQLVAGIAARLQVEVRLRVDDGGAAGEAFHGHGIACSMGTRDFPPTVTYELVTDAEAGDTLLAAGPVPVHVRRETRSGGRCRPFPTDEAAVAADAHDYRLQCLARLLGVPLDALELRGRLEARHTWRDAASFHEAAGVALGDARTAWRQLFERLVARQLLAPADVPAPRVTLRVEDLRADPDEPLPAPRDGQR